MKLAELGGIRILGKEYVIKENQSIRDFGASGRVNLIDNVIELTPGLSFQERGETLLHEIIHACDLSTSAEADVLTESQVMRLSALLYGTLVDAGVLEVE